MNKLLLSLLVCVALSACGDHSDHETDDVHIERHPNQECLTDQLCESQE